MTFIEGALGVSIATLGMTICVDLLYFFKLLIVISMYLYSVIGLYLSLIHISEPTRPY